MKKLNVEKLTTKINNIGTGLAYEMNYLEKTGHVTGKYNKDDLTRIADDAWPIIDYIIQHDREQYDELLHACAWVVMLCQTITKAIDNEEV